MKEHIKKGLLSRGWSEEEIKRVEEALGHSKPGDLFFSRMVFWSAVVVIIFANLVVSLVLIPFLIVFDAFLLYSVIVLLAGTMGFLYNFLIKDLGHLEKRHHLAAGIIVPSIALANLLLMVFVSNLFIADIQISTPEHNLWKVSLVFALAFLSPYLISRAREYFFRKK